VNALYSNRPSEVDIKDDEDAISQSWLDDMNSSGTPSGYGDPVVPPAPLANDDTADGVPTLSPSHGPLFAPESVPGADTPGSTDAPDFLTSEDPRDPLRNAAPAQTDTGMALTVQPTTVEESAYSEFTLGILDEVGVSDYLPKDPTSGPMIAGAAWSQDLQDAADFVLKQSGDQFASNSYGNFGNMFGMKSREAIFSKGVWVGDEGTYDAATGEYTTDINVYDTVEWTWYRPETNHRKMNYNVYSAFDASAAEGEVTFTGLDKNIWHSNYSSAASDKGTLYDVWQDTTDTSRTKYLVYEYGNVFKGGDNGNHVTGGSYADTLIGGQSNDIIYGVDGENVIYGVGGNNKLYAGDGNATVIGGTSDDYINLEGGGGVAFGNAGDNIILAGDTSSGSAVDMVGGTGANTFVLGSVPMAEEATVTDTNAGITSIITGALGNAFIAGLEMLPGGSILTSIGEGYVDLYNYMNGENGSSSGGTEAPKQEVIEIWDFNPIQDRLLIPMNASGSDNIKVTYNDTDGYIEVIDETGGDTVIAKVHFAHASEIFGETEGMTMDALPDWFKTYIDGFVNALQQSSVIVDGEYGAAFNGSSLAKEGVVFDGMEDLGSNRFMLMGAWHGNYMEGVGTGSNDTYFMGTIHDDVMWAYTPDESDPNYDPGSLDGNVFFGFAGDNLFVGGGGTNVYHGGTGTDIAGYYDADRAITVDMSDTSTNANGEFFRFKNGFLDADGIVHNDTVYTTVEGIAGTRHDDDITGNEADNVFVTTDGDNTYTGGGGSNTYHLTGGTATITDFSEDDTIVIHKADYVEGKLNLSSKLSWVEGDTDWMLFNADSAEILAVVQSKDFDEGSNVTIHRDDDTQIVAEPILTTEDSVGFDMWA